MSYASVLEGLVWISLAPQTLNVVMLQMAIWEVLCVRIQQAASCRCIDNRCIDYTATATVVQYPDAFDCGLKKTLLQSHSSTDKPGTDPMPADAVNMDPNDGMCVPPMS